MFMLPAADLDMSRDFTILLNFVINLFLGFFSSNVLSSSLSNLDFIFRYFPFLA